MNDTSSDHTELSRRDDRHFNKELEALLDDAETLRLQAMKTHRNRGFAAMSIGLTAIVIGACGFGWLFLVEAQLVKALGAIILGIVIAAALHLWSGQALQDYKKQHKAVFLPKMAKTLGGFKYHPARGISRKLITKTGLIPAHDVYTAEDCFMGKYKGVKVLFSEARLRHKKAYIEPIFNGIFALLEVPEGSIEGHTILSADKEMVKKWRNSRWQKLQDVDIQTSNPSWDRFTIVSDKPEAAQKIITQDLLKELSEAADIFDKSPLSAALFRKKYIFLMIPYDGDMFEASNIHVPVTTKRHAMQCKKEMEQLLEIVDVFDLYNEANESADIPKQPEPESPAPTEPADAPANEEKAKPEEVKSEPEE